MTRRPKRKSDQRARRIAARAPQGDLSADGLHWDVKGHDGPLAHLAGERHLPIQQVEQVADQREPQARAAVLVR